MAHPKITPPNITFSTSSVNIGVKLNTWRKILLKNTCTRENTVNLMLIPLQHIRATGMFRATMVTCMGILRPHSPPRRSTSMAIPVNPPDMMPAGRTNTCRAYVCISADMITAARVMPILTRLSFFHLLMKAEIRPIHFIKSSAPIICLNFIPSS